MNMNDYFARFHSNTIAGSANQYHFIDEGKVRCGRVFYKIAVGGTYDYSLLFSNSVDSTFSDGAFSRHDMICEPWHVFSCRIGKCKSIPTDRDVNVMHCGDAGEKADFFTEDWKEVSFDGKKEKDVAPGEFFTTDPLTLSFEKGEYLCLELTYQGTNLPCHEQILMPIYNKTEEGFVYDVHMPVPSMIGCDRPVKKSVVFWGDSITQGIGTPNNAYAHWNAFLSEMLPDTYSFWNIGLGWGRAEDGAAEGAWFYKAKQADCIAICFGVNDILQGADLPKMKKNLLGIVTALKKMGKKVFVQTPPPFDYRFSHLAVWNGTVDFIMNELSRIADGVFDTTPVLGRGPAAPQNARYSDHPNPEGCKVWAEALKAPFTAFLERE